jgi:hypothetical protein
MNTREAPAPASVSQAMNLDVRLSRGGPEARWCGEVCTPGGSEKLCFLSLPSLLAWIAQLEPGTRPPDRH